MSAAAVTTNSTASSLQPQTNGCMTASSSSSSTTSVSSGGGGGLSGDHHHQVTSSLNSPSSLDGGGGGGSAGGGSVTPDGLTANLPTANSTVSLSPVETPTTTAAPSCVTISGIATGTGPGGEDIPNDPGKMFIGGLSWQTTPESIREYFSAFGELAEVMVMKDPATRRSRGFGFITFSDPRSVDEVLKYPVHQLDGKLVEPKVAVPRKTNPKLVMRTRKIFVGGLSSSTSLEDIKSYFEQFSGVKEAMLAYDKVTNRHRGFGFVTFDNEDVVDKICEIHFHEINGKMVESKKALPKEPRLAYYNHFYGTPMGGGHFGGHFSPGAAGHRGGNPSMYGGNPYGGHGGGGGRAGYGSGQGYGGMHHNNFNHHDQYGGSNYTHHEGHHSGGGHHSHIPGLARGQDHQASGENRGHLLQMGHFDNANYENSGGGLGHNSNSSYDNEMKYFGGVGGGKSPLGNSSGQGGPSGYEPHRQSTDYPNTRYIGTSSPGNNRSAFNNYGTGGGRDGPRPGGNMYGERSPSHHNQHNHNNGVLDSGNGLGMLSNGYYRDRDVYSHRDYSATTATPGGVGNRFEAGNNNQGTSGDRLGSSSGAGFNEDDFPELTTSKFNSLRLRDDSPSGAGATSTDGTSPSDHLTRNVFGSAGPNLAGF